jgi:hypothetical protein
MDAPRTRDRGAKVRVLAAGCSILLCALYEKAIVIDRVLVRGSFTAMPGDETDLDESKDGIVTFIKGTMRLEHGSLGLGVGKSEAGR